MAGFHNFVKRHADARTHFLRRDFPIECKDAVLRFEAYAAARGITLARRIKYFEVFGRLATRIPKPFEEVTKEDLLQYVSDLQAGSYTEWTKSTHRMVIKRFWKWLTQASSRGPASR